MLTELNKKIKYYFWASYRRKILDKLQNKYVNLYKGCVLDIGGRDRGNFHKPKNIVKKWIFSDIEKLNNPDIIMDVSNMNDIKNESIDVINAIELFEHVEKIENGLRECYRILKKDGTIIITTPFIYPIHADPFDFQRWTNTKWEKELLINNFKIEELIPMGYIFTTIADIIKTIIKSLPFLFKYFIFIFYPLLDTMVKIDNTNFVKKNKKLTGYTTGYFIIAKK